jgi:hypothetical protein
MIFENNFLSIEYLWPHFTLRSFRCIAQQLCWMLPDAVDDDGQCVIKLIVFFLFYFNEYPRQRQPIDVVYYSFSLFVFSVYNKTS